MRIRTLVSRTARTGLGLTLAVVTVLAGMAVYSVAPNVLSLLGDDAPEIRTAAPVSPQALQSSPMGRSLEWWHYTPLARYQNDRIIGYVYVTCESNNLTACSKRYKDYATTQRPNVYVDATNTRVLSLGGPTLSTGKHWYIKVPSAYGQFDLLHQEVQARVLDLIGATPTDVITSGGQQAISTSLGLTTAWTA